MNYFAGHVSCIARWFAPGNRESRVRTFLPIEMLLALFLCSCQSSLLEDFSRSSGDPAITTPVALSFREEYSVLLSWDADECADEYLLYAARDSSNPAYKCIYRGTEPSYVHHVENEGARYLYRMGKLRGQKEFGPSQSSFGVQSEVALDQWEPNDGQSQAAQLEYVIDANTHFFRSYGGEEISDSDWYWVEVPPLRSASVSISDNPGFSNYVNDEDIMLFRSGYGSIAVTKGIGYPILNSSYQTQKMYFRIAPNTGDRGILSSPTEAGGAVLTYRLILEEIY